MTRPRRALGPGRGKARGPSPREGHRRRAQVLALKSFAKINLGLEVMGARQDGYHELRTIFQTISLHDDVTLRLTTTGVTVSCDHPQVPADDTNLASRAARALLEWARAEAGVEIRIAKRIPVAGGLGGGSSNAAAVLLGLDRLLGLRAGRETLLRLGRRLGADVPFFLFGGTALGLGRGDEVYPLREQVRCAVLVIDLERPVSTPAVFARVAKSLTPRENSYSISRFVSSDLEGVGRFATLVNDLEPAALEEAPELSERVSIVRQVLTEGGASAALLSGSGSSFFGLFADVRRARHTARVLAAQDQRVLIERTVTEGEYQRAMRVGS